jgi:hypothetical protein
VEDGPYLPKMFVARCLWAIVGREV